MRRIVIGLAVVALAACAESEAPPADTEAPAAETTAQEPGFNPNVTRRVPQFENEHVEVWKSIIYPDQPLSMHRHDNPRAIISLNGGTLTVVTDQGDEYDMTWEAGQAYWLDADPPGRLHGDVNKGTEPVEVIVVQMKN